MDEGFSHQQMGRSTDCWSFGCITGEIATLCNIDILSSLILHEIKLGMTSRENRGKTDELLLL